VPTKMKALFCTRYPEKYGDDLTGLVEVREIDVPVPKSGEVLVKMECAPINPSDVMTLSGIYNASELPAPPHQIGYEGSGTVVASGGGVFGWLVTGKRVAVASNIGGGTTWAEYMVMPAAVCLPLPDDVSFEEGSSSVVNPFTVVSMVMIAKSRGLKAMVHTAAASALGKMLFRYAAANGIDIINVVRRQAQVEKLQDLGAKYVINTSQDGWEGRLQEVAHSLGATLGFDAVGGSLSGQVLHAMPNGSELSVYGALSDQPCNGISPTEFIFSGKSLTGFWLGTYLKSKNIFFLKSLVDSVSANLKDVFRTDVRARYPLEQTADAVKDYLGNMTDGKVVLVFNDSASS